MANPERLPLYQATADRHHPRLQPVERRETAMDTELHFPFSALVGQEPLQLALLLAAVDPGIGGVLVQGPRGTAKSTSARGLADLLPEGRFVTLPLGSSEERLLGSLDLEQALGAGKVRFRPGLLQAAHLGVLYVDEVNLLPDHLVDLLLDVAASGINRVERDGVSHAHPARFVLVGTMNPEEGDLRPQLLDRFGFCVALAPHVDSTQRVEIVRRRLDFDADPAGFLAAQADAQRHLSERCRDARGRLSAITFDPGTHDKVARRCHDAVVEGVRADLVMLRGARAHAAWQGRGSILDEDVEAVAELALSHRRQQTQPPPPLTSDSRRPEQSRPRVPAGDGDRGEFPPQAVATGGARDVAGVWGKN